MGLSLYNGIVVSGDPIRNYARTRSMDSDAQDASLQQTDPDVYAAGFRFDDGPGAFTNSLGQQYVGGVTLDPTAYSNLSAPQIAQKNYADALALVDGEIADPRHGTWPEDLAPGMVLTNMAGAETREQYKTRRMREMGFSYTPQAVQAPFQLMPTPAPYVPPVATSLFAPPSTVRAYPYEGIQAPTVNIAPSTFIAGDFARVPIYSGGIPTQAATPDVALASGARNAVTDNHTALIVLVLALVAGALLLK